MWAVGVIGQKSEVESFGLCCIQDVPMCCLTEEKNYCVQCVW